VMEGARSSGTGWVWSWLKFCSSHSERLLSSEVKSSQLEELSVDLELVSLEAEASQSEAEVEEASLEVWSCQLEEVVSSWGSWSSH